MDSDKYFIERLLNVIDEINDMEPVTKVRRDAIRTLLENNGLSDDTETGRALLEELYFAIYY